MLTLQDIHFGVEGKPHILNGIDMTLAAGEMVVVTGPNGGGKTSLAKIIAGINTPTAGKLFLNGEDITAQDISARAKSGIAYAFQQPVRFKGVTTRKLMELAAGRELTEAEVVELLRRVGLSAKDYLDREVDAKLSGGEIKRIEIASVMARDAAVYVFDEPEAGIDIWSFSNLIKVFGELRQKRDGTILIISHQERILEIADRIAVIAKGRLTAFGEAKEILKKLSEDATCRSCEAPCVVTEDAV